MSVAVAYLARGIGAGLSAAEEFVRSYLAHDPGHGHRLYILAKGWENRDDLEALVTLSVTAGATLVELPDDGFDWGAYQRFAAEASEQWTCFLNSHSRIEVNGWLGILLRHARTPSVGAAGCTGSWGTLAPIGSILWPLAVNECRFSGVARALGLLARSTLAYLPHRIMLRRSFPGFPNPHLRSNAFVIETGLFRQFMGSRAFPASKLDAHRLESGHCNLTSFLRSRNLSVVVSGANEMAYGSEKWIVSRTFRTPDQSNLLVSDNQTRGYLAASLQEKRIMELSAWGRFCSFAGKKNAAIPNARATK